MKQLLLCICLVILSACNIQTVEHYEEEQALIEKSVAQPSEEIVQQQAEVTDEVDEQREQEALVTEGNEQSTQQAETTSEAAENVTEAAPTPTRDEPQETEQKQPVAEAQTEAQQKSPPQPQQQKPEPEQPVTKEPSPTKETVTIAIEATTLLDEAHYAMLKKPLQSEQYVPADGIILPRTTYEIVREEETVFHILQRAVREFDIHLEYEGADENIYNSVYIEGINHLYEFSAGNLSGWIYEVNGVAPAKGASQYVVQPGDTITWHYTVDLGKDIGGVIRE